MKRDKAKSYALRLEVGLVDPLQRLKKQNRRSLNAEINAALEAWVGRAPAEGEPPTPSAKPRKKKKAADSEVAASPA